MYGLSRKLCNSVIPNEEPMPACIQVAWSTQSRTHMQCCLLPQLLFRHLLLTLTCYGRARVLSGLVIMTCMHSRSAVGMSCCLLLGSACSAVAVTTPSVG